MIKFLKSEQGHEMLKSMESNEDMDLVKSKGPWKHKHAKGTVVKFNHPKKGEVYGHVQEHDKADSEQGDMSGKPIYGVNYVHSGKEKHAWKHEHELTPVSEHET